MRRLCILISLLIAFPCYGAWRFNNVDIKAQTNNNTTVPSSGGSYTIMFWVYLTDIPATYSYFLRKGIEGAGNSFWISFGDALGGIYDFTWSGGGNNNNYRVLEPIERNKWQHLCWTWHFTNANSFHFYKNGKEIAGSIVAGSGAFDLTTTNLPLVFSKNNYEGFDGFMADVKIFNKILKPNQIVTEMNTVKPAVTSSEIALWLCDNNFGTNTKDWTGITGTITCGASADVAPPSGNLMMGGGDEEQ